MNMLISISTCLCGLKHNDIRICFNIYKSYANILYQTFMEHSAEVFIDFENKIERNTA